MVSWLPKGKPEQKQTVKEPLTKKTWLDRITTAAFYKRTTGKEPNPVLFGLASIYPKVKRRYPKGWRTVQSRLKF